MGPDGYGIVAQGLWNLRDSNVLLGARGVGITQWSNFEHSPAHMYSMAVDFETKRNITSASTSTHFEPGHVRLLLPLAQ